MFQCIQGLYALKLFCILRLPESKMHFERARKALVVPFDVDNLQGGGMFATLALFKRAGYPVQS